MNDLQPICITCCATMWQRRMIITTFSELFLSVFVYLSTSTCTSDLCRNRCENGILSTCYPTGELMPYTGSVPFKYSSKLPIVP